MVDNRSSSPESLRETARTRLEMRACTGLVTLVQLNRRLVSARTDGEQYPTLQMSSSSIVSTELQEVQECHKQGHKGRKVSLNIDVDCGSKNEEYGHFSMLSFFRACRQQSVVQPLEEKELLKDIYGYLYSV